MKKYEILEHTADLKIKAFGKDIKELFSNMAEGMFNSISPKAFSFKTQETKEKKEIKIKSQDKEALLVDWLSELSYFHDTTGKIYTDFKISKITDTELEAHVFGIPSKEGEVLIKGVTYHDLKIEKKDDLWEATVIFDI